MADRSKMFVSSAIIFPVLLSILISNIFESANAKSFGTDFSPHMLELAICINFQSNQFTLLFHETSKYVGLFRGRLITYSNYTALVTNQVPQRHTQPSYIILAPTYHSTSLNLLDSVEYFTMFSTTILLFLENASDKALSQKIFHSWYFQCPALVAIYNYKTTANKVQFLDKINLQFVYFGIGSPDVFKSTTNLLAVHKNLFWNANLATLYFKVSSPLAKHFKFGMNKFSCQILFMQPLDTKFCKYDVLFNNNLGLAHNYSLAPFSVNQPSTIQPNPLIHTGFTRSWDRKLQIDFLSSFWQLALEQSHHFTRELLMYCRNVSVDKLGILKIWTGAFSFFVWIILLFLLASTSSFACVLEKGKYGYFNCFLQTLSVLIGQGCKNIEEKRLLYLLIALLGMFLSNFYGNSITSLVSVNTPPKPLDTVKKVLENGFKIFIDYSLFSDITPEKTYEFVFELKQISKFLNHSFRADLENYATKFSVIMDHREISWKRAGIEAELNAEPQLDTYQCNHAIDSLSESLIFTRIKTVNRFWMWKTVRAFWESGLIEYWEHLSAWYTMIYKGWGLKGPNENKPVLVEDQIGFEKFKPCLFTYLVINFIATFVWLVSVYKACGQDLY